MDDLQWADIATLQLLYALFTYPESGYLLIIGAYRDNEVDATHPLARTFPLEDHREELTQLERLRLGPLDLVSLGQFIGDTLHRDPEEIASLSRLVKEKTDGNPFFVTQFLKSLHHQGLIQFDDAKHHWTFRAEEIVNAAITDNVVDLMSARIQQLSKPAQEAVKIAACFGAAFDLATLAGSKKFPLTPRPRICTKQLSKDSSCRWRVQDFRTRTGQRGHFLLCFTTEFSKRLTNRSYRSDASCVTSALDAYCLSRSAGQLDEKELFTAVSHFNLGRQLITTDREKVLLSHLNFDAGC